MPPYTPPVAPGQGEEADLMAMFEEGGSSTSSPEPAPPAPTATTTEAPPDAPPAPSSLAGHPEVKVSMTMAKQAKLAAGSVGLKITVQLENGSDQAVAMKDGKAAATLAGQACEIKEAKMPAEVAAKKTTSFDVLALCKGAEGTHEVALMLNPAGDVDPAKHAAGKASLKVTK